MAQIMKAEYTEIISEQQSDAIQFEELCIESVKGNAEDCVSVSLGYRRCKDFDEGNQPGQDFASVRGDKHYIVGVVADGVSQSFYGNLAAAYLSQFLLGYLW